jgi:hypothetical protein
MGGNKEKAILQKYSQQFDRLREHIINMMMKREI